jgi:hypothetical protein
MSSNRSNSIQKNSSSFTSMTRSTTETTPSTKKTDKTKVSPPKDRNFVQKLSDYNVHQDRYRGSDGIKPQLPPDWDQVNQTLAQYRASLSPSVFPTELYERLQKEDAKATSKPKVVGTVLPAMLAAMGAKDGAEYDVQFTNFESIALGISQPRLLLRCASDTTGQKGARPQKDQFTHCPFNDYSPS